MEQVLVIVDIDGTCSDATKRFLEAGPDPGRDDKPGYLAWLSRLQDVERLSQDRPVPGMAAMILTLSKQHRMYYVSGREEQYREVTKAWLSANGFPARPLILRQPEDWRSASEFKAQVISELKRSDETVIVLDDCPEPQLVDVCLKNNYTLLRAMSGGAK